MTGLIWKDFLILRKVLRAYALFLLFYLLLSVLGAFDLSFVLSFIQVVILVLPLSTFSYDEYARWDRYATTLPLSRQKLVSARYGFTLLLLLCAAAFGGAACVFSSLLDQTPGDILATTLVCLGTGIFIVDVMLPLCYKLGPERARPFLFAIVLLPLIVLFAADKLDLLSGLDLSWLDHMPTTSLVGMLALVPLAGLAGMAVSYLISCRIVEKKEF